MEKIFCYVEDETFNGKSLGPSCLYCIEAPDPDIQGYQFVLCEMEEKYYENGKQLLIKNKVEFTDGGSR